MDIVISEHNKCILLYPPIQFRHQSTYFTRTGPYFAIIHYSRIILHTPSFQRNLLTEYDQICQKGSYTCTVSGLTFHGHLTDTTIDQQFMLVPLPKLQQSAFTEASFMGLSGIYGCSGGL